MTATESLRIIIGFSPGSASDDIANLIAEPLSAALNRLVVIDRMPGDNGAHAARAVADATPDGNTLFVATLGTHALAPHVRNDLPYHPLQDFAPVSLLAQSPMLLACHPSLSTHNIAEFIAYARAHPNEVTYGTSAVGGAPHLAAELFQTTAHIEMRHVRYDQTQQLYADLENGRIMTSFNNVISMLPRCGDGKRHGKLRALGVSASTRCAVAADIPTIAESGLAGYEVSNWLGLVAPRATPTDIVQSIHRAAAAAMRTEPVTDTLQRAGVTPRGSTPEDFADFLARELNRWKPVVARFKHVHG